MLVINKWSKETRGEFSFCLNHQIAFFETVKITVCAWNNNKYSIFYNKQADKLYTSSLT